MRPYPPTTWDTKSEIKVRRPALPPEAPGEDLSWLLQLRGLQASLGLWLCPSCAASMVTWPLSCVCQNSPFMKTSAVG